MDRRLLSRAARAAAFLLVLAACSESTAPRHVSVALETDREAYTAHHVAGAGDLTTYGFFVNARFENRGNVTVWVARCTPTSLEPVYYVSLIDGAPGEVSAYATDGTCPGHDEHLEVRAGASRVDELFIIGPNTWGASGPRGALSGRMRLLYHVETCARHGECDEPGTVMSNEFTVTLASSPTP